MKKLFTFSFILFLFAAFNTNAQVFWTENFESGSSAGLTVDTYTGPNGPWTLTVTGIEATKPNIWYVSCAENGHTLGVCGTGCVPPSATATGATLHIGSNPAVAGDMGAAYNSGGLCFGSSSSSSSSSFSICVTTNRRAESPTINCTGRTGIRLSFYYIEDGDGAIDDGSVYYSPDNGVTWSLLINTAKTPPICPGGQGFWDTVSVALPASANNNSTVKIGFLWINNDDGTGTDPSYAIDSMKLSGALIPPPPPVAVFTTSSTTACQDSCITFTSTSTGTVDSIRWSMPGIVIPSPTTTPLTLCFPASGTFTMHLYAYNAGGVDSTTQTVTINRAPHPPITHSAHHLSVPSTGYTAYQWANSSGSISGATTAAFTYSVSGTYIIVVDSNGCFGWDTITVSTVGITSISAATNKYWVVQQGNGSITLNASNALDESLTINMFDVSGRQLFDETWVAGTSEKQINDVPIPPGSYIIKLSNQNTSEVLKWIKQ
jgi:hypothetical protein